MVAPNLQDNAAGGLGVPGLGALVKPGMTNRVLPIDPGMI
jgi:hypothetical protein